jgi:phosphate transport system substrate-binding protein
MMVCWAEEYRKLGGRPVIEVSAGGAGKGMADALSGMADLGMVSREINSAEIKKGAWWVSVVRDAVVPTMSASNPGAGDIIKRGIKRSEFEGLFVKGEKIIWSKFSGKTSVLVKVYTRSDACGAAETWAKYLGAAQEDLKGIGVYGDPGLAEAVRRDSSGIGYNNVNFLFDAGTKKPVKGLLALPIDINGNGKVDPDENFFDSRDSLMNAIALGRYPSPPARDLHIVAKGNPAKKAVRDFLKWVLTEGQAYVDKAGYIKLPLGRVKAEMQKIIDN